MATINTIDDFLRIVRENEEYRAALRRELLTSDLLALPAQFAEMLETQNELRETQNRILAEQEESRRTQNRILAEQEEARQTRNRILAHIDELRETQNGLGETQNDLRDTQNNLLETQNDLRDTQNNLLETQNEILRRLDNVEEHNRRLSNDFGAFRGNYAESAAVKNAADIAIMLNESKSLGIDETSVRVLSGDDLRALARKYGSEKLTNIPLEQRRSFYRADLVMEVAKSDGTTFYIAVQASYTCNGRDTARALTHAELLTRFTGQEAWPVIAGVRLDRLIQPAIDDGQIFWYPLEYDDMEPSEPL